MPTVVADLINGRFPMNSAPKNCNAGISSGKLKGAMITTDPNGHL